MYIKQSFIKNVNFSCLFCEVFASEMVNMSGKAAMQQLDGWTSRLRCRSEDESQKEEGVPVWKRGWGFRLCWEKKATKLSSFH